MTHVRETPDGWEVVEGARVRSEHASPTDALNAALPSVRAGRTKAPLFHDRATKRPNGEWRWFDAAGEEPEAIRGNRHDAVTIEELVASLNATEIARPIDGGPASSEHGTEIVGSDTLANGWAHWAVLVERADGTKHAATYAEVHPAVAPFTDDGRLAFLSIATRGKSLTDDAAIRGAEWSSASFTNKPGNRSLMSLAAMRTEDATEVVAHRTHRLDAYARRTETSMSTETNAPVIAKRAEIADDLLAAYQMLAEKCGLAPDASPADIMAAAEKMGEPAAMESEKADASKDEPKADATRSEAAVLARIEKLEQEHERATLRSLVEHEFAKAKAKPADLDGLVSDMLAVRSEPIRSKLLGLAVKVAVGAPPPPREIAATRSENIEAEASSDVSEAAIEAELVAVRAEFPKDPKHHQWARARKRALAKKNGR